MFCPRRWEVVMKTVSIPLDSLDCCYESIRVRSPVAERKLLTSIGECGQQCPVIVTPAEVSGRYVLIEGHKRVQVLRRLKADEVDAIVWKMAPIEALVMCYQMKARGGWNALEEGWLVGELVHHQGWSLAQAGERLVRSKSWAGRRLGLVESLPEDVLNGVRRGTISVYVAIRYLLPLARANTADCKRLAAQIRKEGWSSRQVHTIYQHYKQGTRKQAKQIIENPVEFLKALEAAEFGPVDPKLSASASRCLKNVRLLGNLAVGVTRRLPQIIGYDTAAGVSATFREAWRQTQHRIQMLEQTAAAIWSADRRSEESSRHAG